ncbi:hypothetical protein [Tahibacter caeni]|uniref:hypothetical protein n=1 Tax=Tahibacter caeni TaxID=1453545 RepID=UPI002147417B|nr:hypothetical protein [Tahibacter caeni]
MLPVNRKLGLFWQARGRNLSGATIETPRHSDERDSTARQETAEPEASLRVELIGRLTAASFELEARLAEISRAAGVAGGVGEARAQLAQLTALSRSVATASPASLATLRTEITANLTAATNLAQQIKTEATTGQAARAAEFAAINADTRRTVESLSADLYERRIFAPYLKFDSSQDEADYREREAERQRYIAEQMAKNTPQGNLNAGGAVAGQMLDAETHGAGESPDFAPRWNELREQLRKQRRTVESEGLSTEEYDRNLRANVHRFLAAKGVPEAEIDAKLKAATDPLDAAQPYLATVKDAESLKAELGADAPPAGITANPAAPSTPNLSQQPQLGTLAATLQISGVILTDAARPGGHGLTAAITATKTEGRTA